MPESNWNIFGTILVHYNMFTGYLSNINMNSQFTYQGSELLGNLHVKVDVNELGIVPWLLIG